MLTIRQFENLDFDVPLGGSSVTPKTAFSWDKSEIETLYSLSQYDDDYDFNEVLGKGWTEWKPMCHLRPKIKRDKPIKVYRASNNGDILPGAYVTESIEYAKEHGEAYLDNGYKIYSLEVKPSELLTYGDPHEFLYIPESVDIAYKRYKENIK